MSSRRWYVELKVGDRRERREFKAYQYSVEDRGFLSFKEYEPGRDTGGTGYGTVKANKHSFNIDTVLEFGRVLDWDE